MDGTDGVISIGHGVEGSERDGELVDNVVVRLVLLLDKNTEGLFRGGTVDSESVTVEGAKIGRTPCHPRHQWEQVVSPAGLQRPARS